jgi:uncharacterized membrane-anchored protein
MAHAPCGGHVRSQKDRTLRCFLIPARIDRRRAKGNKPMRAWFVGLLLLVGLAAPAVADPADLTVADVDAKFAQLHWQTAGSRRLAESHAALAVPPGYLMVVGDDAVKVETMLGNIALPHLEAAIHNRANHFVIQHFDDGYVTLDDWGDIDAKVLLAAISEATEKANEQRRRQGAAEIHLGRWIREPALDRPSATVHWAYGATEGTNPIVNVVALRLSRGGFDKITLATDQTNYGLAAGNLDAILGGMSFDPGYRYADHIATDKVAEYGVAALVAAVAGVKLAQFAVLGTLLVLAKKFGVFGLALIVAAGYWLRRIFTKTKTVG